MAGEEEKVCSKVREDEESGVCLGSGSNGAKALKKAFVSCLILSYVFLTQKKNFVICFQLLLQSPVIVVNSFPCIHFMPFVISSLTFL